MTMGEGSRASLLIGRQDAPGVARADSHQFSRLIQGNVLGEKAVQNLKSVLFFRGQSHIHHGVNVTFSAGQLVRTLLLVIDKESPFILAQLPILLSDRSGDTSTPFRS